MLVGRSAELAALTAVLGAAQDGRSATLCLEGVAGAGRTALLDAAVDAAVGFRCVRGAGAPTELNVGHATLLELLTPLRAHLPGLPGPQRDTLGSALGWSSGDTGGDRFLVAAATMSLLAAAAEEMPLLVVLDDVQWVDRESTRAVAFAARRLRHDRVAFLLARRLPAAEPDDLAGLPRLAVPGLDADAAASLLRGRVAPQVMAAVLTATGGLPLALTEVVRSLTAEQRRGSAPLPDPLPVGEHLTDGVDELVDRLPSPARRALLLAAVASSNDAGPVVEALRAEGLDPDVAIADAERGGALAVDAAALDFAHPLLRAAVLRAADPAQRRGAHAALAAVLVGDPDRHTRHRAQAAIGYDDALAADLEALAGRERARRGAATAADLLERAARLRPSAPAAAAARALAAEDALVAGDGLRVRRLAAEALAGPIAPADRGRAQLALGVLEQHAGAVPASVGMLREAAACASGTVRLRALTELALAGYRLGSPTAVTEIAAEVRELAVPGDPEQEMLADYTEAVAAAFGGRWDRAREPALRALHRLETDPRMRDEPHYLAIALLAPAWAGELDRARGYVDRRLAAARSAGALGVLPLPLVLIAGAAALVGEHGLAYATAGEAAELGTELGYVVDVGTAHELLAWQEAARGRPAEAVEAIATARRLAEQAGVAGGAVALHLVDAFAALCRGDMARVVQLLEARIAADGGRLPRGDHPLAVAPDLVEAYLALGRRADAEALAEKYADLHAGSVTPAVRALVDRLRGMVAPDDTDADAAFERAHEAHSGGGDGLDAARTRLLHGSRLRRAGQRVAARVHLQRAADTCTALGLDGWAARAVDELAASGQRATRGPGTRDRLTSRETGIALLVAQGLSNRDIATSLFLSPRTVEHHVSAVLRKRGLRSRAALAVAFATPTG